MSDRSPARASLRRLAREVLCDHGAALTVLGIACACNGWYVLAAGVQLHQDLLTAIGVLGLASPCVVAWILCDPDAPERRRISGSSASQIGDIARMTDEEFERLLHEVERQARTPFPPAPPVAGGTDSDDGAFALLVREALDELPEFVQDELRRGNLAVMVSDYGCEWQAYGLYCGGTSADDDCNHRITIFRDTLTASFGDDPDELRRQVEITVRHEVAHHFGADERRVRKLGL